MGGIDGKHADGWLMAGYLGVAGLLSMEVFVRKRGTASSLDTTSDDDGTTRMLVTASGVAATLPLVLRRAPLPQLSWPAAPLGVALQVGGLALRVWSMRTLGTYYTRTLHTEDDQHVVDTGPYRVVRHPGYAGALLIWTGLSLTSRSVASAVAVAALMGGAFQRRISAEEVLLQRDLPGYDDYSRRTRKLLPFVW